MKKYNKIILNIPHSSLYVPPHDNSYVDLEEMDSTLISLTDFYTDVLFMGEEGVEIDGRPLFETFIYPNSRIYCDVERFLNDDLEPMSKKGMGVYYTKGINNKHFRNKTEDSYNSVIESYDKYHNEIRESILSSNKENEIPLLIDCHSFSDKRFINDGVLDGDDNFPDICIGYNENYGRNDKLIDFLTDRITYLGYTVRHNYPYNGSLYYSDLNHDSVMIEINKRLYLTDKNEKAPDFYKIRNLILYLYREISKNFII